MKKAATVFLLLFLSLIAQAFDFTINKMKYTLDPSDSTVSVSAQHTSLPSGDLEIVSIVEFNGENSGYPAFPTGAFLVVPESNR